MLFHSFACRYLAAHGGDAAAQHVLDRSAIPEEGRRRAVPVSPDAHVHLRLRLLSEEEQSVDHIRGIFAAKNLPFDNIIQDMYFPRLSVRFQDT